MATILDGKALSAQCKETIRKEVEELAAKGCRPGMAVVLVGENPASKEPVPFFVPKRREYHAPT